MTRGTVLFADVIGSRRDAQAAVDGLRHLAATLDAAYQGRALAPFGFTQGDELQGLLDPRADPIRAVLLAFLAPEAWPMRWAVATGDVDEGTGPATERTGAAFVAARSAIEETRARRAGFILRTGDAAADAFADDLTPLLAELLARLTTRQREIARLVLVDGLRQVDVAERLGISRAAVSIAVNRALIRSIGRLADAIRRCHEAGVRGVSPLEGAGAWADVPPTEGSLA